MSEQLHGKKKLVLVASKGTADALYPALILATTASAQGMPVHIYFTFGGMKLLTRGSAGGIKPSADLGLSQEQLAGLLQKGGMPSLPDMLKAARESGVKIHACSPTMNLFGMTEKDLADGVCDDVIGAATFLQLASDPEALALFI
ncbi:MAG: DsrE/DsrF/DrsH-like family protein [Nitrososphaerota archaeon]|nr:DsrE/DsrF/DrsH-like family protein [Nitrososphaerota archaeon]